MKMKTRDRRTTSLAGPVDVRAEAELAPGVCGVLVGVALVYGVVDSYGTRFRVGCLDRTKREKLAAGKVKVFADHEGRTRTHVGYVKTLETQGDREIMTAWLFDTEAGRSQKEYLAACMASGGYTGLSIGFYPRETEMVEENGDTIYDFLEVELDEVSNTPRPAVPGADVLGVRHETQGRASEAAYAKGDRITSTADHTEGMLGATGAVALVRDGPYYGIRFDGTKRVHKWLAESEIEPQTGPDQAMAPMKMAATSVFLLGPDALRATLRVVIERLGVDTVRAELAVRAAASNATPDDTANATGHAPADTRDADGTDSRDGTSAVSVGATTATMDERLTAVRRSYSLR
jgi:HK97 family phage prohead protease